MEEVNDLIPLAPSCVRLDVWREREKKKESERECTEEYKGRTDSTSTTGPNEGVRVTTLLLNNY